MLKYFSLLLLVALLVDAKGPAKRTPLKKSLVKLAPAKTPAKKPIVARRNVAKKPVGKTAAKKQGPVGPERMVPSPPPNTGVRTRTQYDAAMSYMKAQGPIEKSGDTPIDELVASNSDAAHSVPFDAGRFHKARQAYMTKDEGEPDQGDPEGCDLCSAGTAMSKVSKLAVVVSVLMVILL